MRVVLDASAALAWIYGDEITDEIKKVFDLIAEHGALVPALWRLEVMVWTTAATGIEYRRVGRRCNATIRGPSRWRLRS